MRLDVEKRREDDASIGDKVVLVVVDEADMLDIVEDVLDMCLVHKARDYDTARQHRLSYSFDIVVLDIMGVNGFELLKTSVQRGFPTVMPPPLRSPLRQWRNPQKRELPTMFLRKK